MNYFRIGSLAGVLLLCGCQAPTPDQARQQQPVFQGQSTRTVPQLSDCIYRGWSTTSVIARDNTTHTQPDGSEISVFTWEDSIFADVSPRRKGAEVKYFTTFRMAPQVMADRQAIVERCL
ncbi:MULTISPECIES: hypothetical protein [Pantoea]|uniref:hypothetical protein n=1 Tax=Enterobacter agglomerans TaxID=549 RepID=UPI00057FD9CC|nr:hypothetical protein [Pantoea agglomerans]KIC85683.1 hypothetical protein RN49_17265 [Pantoea agglomerans]MBA5704879.1 hypothetical protein [Pantoea agglomerans]NKE95385.1 hypothetical protein [Pantoea agglomerans]TRO76919.1 hypothetical protein E5140_02015 [Pantoea agglomerans]SUB03225.1 Uncharacterised protein [Pantoea agglomerans]